MCYIVCIYTYLAALICKMSSTFEPTLTPADEAKLLEIAQSCVCFNLLCARAVTQYFDVLFQAHGLRATQFTLLGALAIAEKQTLSLSITQIAELMVMDRSTLTRNLQPLAQRDGWPSPLRSAQTAARGVRPSHRCGTFTFGPGHCAVGKGAKPFCHSFGSTQPQCLVTADCNRRRRCPEINLLGSAELIHPQRRLL